MTVSAVIPLDIFGSTESGGTGNLPNGPFELVGYAWDDASVAGVVWKRLLFGDCGAAFAQSFVTDPVSGVITRQNKTLDTRTQEFQDRIKNLDKLLTTKRERLERQFSNLENVLSNLQNQQQAIGQIPQIRPVQRAAG